MEGMHPERCLICYTGLPRGGGDLIKGKWSKSGSLLLSRQLEVIFTLRKVLEIPEEKVSKFLEEWGDPGEWIRLCEKCEECVEKVKRVYEEILELQRRFRGVQQDVVRIVKRSCEENGDGRKKRRKIKTEDSVIITDECREIVRSQNHPDYLIDPFIAGDLKASALAAASLIVKQEVDLDHDLILPDLEHNDNLSYPSGLEDEGDDEWSFPTKPKNARRSKSTRRRKPPPRTKRIRKSLSEEDPENSDNENEKTENSALCHSPSSKRTGYSIKEFQRIIKTYRMEDSKKSSEIIVLCPLCSKFQCTPLQSDKLCEHLKTCRMNEPDAILSCPNCHAFTRQGIDQYQEFTEHLTNCITGGDLPLFDNRLFLCDVCDEGDRKFMKVYEFLEHYLYHTRYRLKCTQCNHRFCDDASKYTHYHFSVHHLAHVSDHPSTRSVPDPRLPQVPWRCPLCPEKFPTDDERNQHYDLNHKSSEMERSHVCQWCSKDFFCLEELHLHHGIHHVYDEKQRVSRSERNFQRRDAYKKVKGLKRKKVESEPEDVVDHSDNQNESTGDEDWQPPEDDSDKEPDKISNELQSTVEQEIAHLSNKLYSKKIFQDMVKRLLDKKKQKTLQSSPNDPNAIDKHKSYNCSICPDYQDLKLESFLDHYLYHKRRVYKCTRCSHRFPSSESQDTNYHYKYNHSEFLNEPSSTRAVRDPILPEYLWRCSNCPAQFSEETQREEHLMEVHPSEHISNPLKCNCCPKAYPSLEEFLVHIAGAHVAVAKVRRIQNKKSEIKSKVPKCSICLKEFPNSILLSEHQRELHKDELYICDCGKLCKSASGLRFHSVHCQECTLKHEPLVEDQKSKAPLWTPNATPKPRTRYLQCPLCNDSKTKSGLGERLCRHLDLCKKKEEWEEQGGNISELFLECIYCKEYRTQFENKIDFVDHITWCKREEANSEENVEVDISNRLRSRIFECDLCTKSKLYMKTDAFLTHYMYHKRHHYKCTHCGAIFNSSENASSHFVLNHPTLLKDIPPSSRFTSDPTLPHFTWLCHYCPSQFPNDDLRDSHIISDHPLSSTNILTPATSLSGSVKVHRCVQCPKAFDFITELKLHEGTAHLTEDNQYPCDQCPSKLPNPKLLRQHKIDKHQADLVICDICGQKMKGIYLKNHMQTHQEIRSHLCDHPGCGSSFATKQMLKLHTFQKHTPKEAGKNPLVCPHCPEPRVYHDRSYLRNHIRQVHFKVHDVQCHLCGKGMQCNYHLQKHLCKIHGIGTVGMFKCQVEGCSKKFYEKGLFKEHMDRHRGEPQHKCEFCGKEFYFKTGLRRHELIHKNAESKPYQCEICAKRFPVQNYLYIHMRSHKNRGELLEETK